MALRGGRILLVEDDPRLLKLLDEELSYAGYETVSVALGGEALERAESEAFDLIVLDLALPDIDGIEVAERLHGQNKASILMLTARGDVDSRVRGLYAGASDYLTKPFSVHELLARIHVRLRERETPRGVLVHGEVVLDAEAGSCTVSGIPVKLTANEFALLKLLLSYQDRIFPKEDLENRLYDALDVPGSNAIEVFVSRLRKKLTEAGVDGLISTVRGMGYVVRRSEP